MKLENKTEDRDAVFEPLVESLSNELKAYKNLADILFQKQRSIIGGDIESLNECVANEQGCVKQILSYIENRKKQVDVLSEKWKLNETPKLREIVKIAPGNCKKELTRYYEQLTDIVRKITRLNNENRYLLNFAIIHNREMINILSQSNDDVVEIYNSAGIISLPKNGNRVLNLQI